MTKKIIGLNGPSLMQLATVKPSLFGLRYVSINLPLSFLSIMLILSEEFSKNLVFRHESQVSDEPKFEDEIFANSGEDEDGLRQPSLQAQLTGIEWRTELPDSIAARKRWSALVAKLSAVYERSPVCSASSQPRFRVLKAVWPGVPSSSVSSEVTVSADGQSHHVESVVVVQIPPQSASTAAREPVECPESSVKQTVNSDLLPPVFTLGGKVVGTTGPTPARASVR